MKRRPCALKGQIMTTDYYSDAPLALVQELKLFRATHAVKRLVINGLTWTYTVSGRGETPLLWLVGGLRVGDAAFRSIPLLEDSFKIIVPDFAPVMTMAELADGLTIILTAEAIGAAHVLGGSFGGMVAQVFAHRYPDRVHKLILSTTTPPDPAAAPRTQEQMALVESMNESIVREGAKLRMLDILQPSPVEVPFWQSYLNELFSVRLGKADMLSTYACMLDYMTQYTFTPHDLAAWQNRILILDSDNDATFGPEVQAQLKALYPSALGYTFQGAGHSPGSTQRDTYFTLVRNFLMGVTG